MSAGQNTHLNWFNVGIGFCFVAADAVVSYGLGLGVGTSLVSAAIRCTVQLSIMALVLQSVFEASSPWAVAGISCLLLVLGSFETVANKSKYRFSGMLPSTFVAMAISTIPVSIIGTRFAMSETKFWAAEKYIPILGMLCGSTISGIVVATTSVLKELHENRDKVETYLAFGASRYEACKPIATSALRLALTPTINQMSVIGLISIPGMMTGAILGGASVDQAAKLQMVIMFMINACTTLASIVGMFSALYRAIDDCARIRSDRIFSEKFILWRARDRAFNGVVDAGKAGYQKLLHPRQHSSANGNGERAPLLG
ncbi:ABC transporter permease, putative [Rhizoctonia solani AG-3 Rhs1AP]|uniref:ABC transporter permease, putative n=1 Tax=Rhizoctonia solani AG-3 Rhs1AP TaxID=1086054 RepID=X8JM94_9AGAM|nr:ABC transporter permease, putative [Rhizoctonia solani AG-3 Rhs1AP]